MSSIPAALDAFHPKLAGWFRETFGEPTPVQLDAWASIGGGRHTLIAAPTGSGKTLAALLPCLDRLVRAKTAAEAHDAPWKPGVRVLYVTPLKALNNDIQHHLTGFIDAIDRFQPEGEAADVSWPGIRSAVRTGDTPSSERAKMTRRPPDVLITTPESLYLLLTSEKGRAMLQTVQSVIVDEIHGLAPDKRGAHLSLSLERLSALCGAPVQRIGVSATQKPLSRVARFLGGWERPDLGPSGLEPEATRRGTAMTEAPSALADEPQTADCGVQGSSADPSRSADRGAQGVFTDAARLADRGVRVLSADAAPWTDRGTRGPSADPAPSADRGVLPVSGSVGIERGAAAAHPLGFVPRFVTIIESDMQKTMQVRVTMPDLSKPAKTRDAVWQPIIERLLQLMEGSRSALLFVNSRRICERLVLRLNDHAGFEMARAHHGSLSRERRLEVERMLKDGELRCIIATSSLELGIDVGHVDVVIQIDSPKAAAAGIQRIGRAGHAVGDISRGFILARTRSELPEAAVLCRDIARRNIEEITLPQAPIDVLTQHVTSIVASGDIEVSSLYALIAGSECYRGLPPERLEAALKVLAGFYPFARPLIEWDRGKDVLSKRASTSMAAIMGAGTIPQSSAYPVHHADSRIHLGELDEEYIAESRVGDVFQLGTTSWMISRIENDRVYVKEAPNRFSEIPFWRNEPGGRGYDLGIRLGAFLGELDSRLGLSDGGQSAGETVTAGGDSSSALPASAQDGRLQTAQQDIDADAKPPFSPSKHQNEKAADREMKAEHRIEKAHWGAGAERQREEAAILWLDAEYGLDRAAAADLIDLARAQHRALALPTDRRIVIEHYRDLTNQMRVIIHNTFGRRINRTWLLAIERQFEKLLPYKLYGNAKDNGIELVLPEWDSSWLQTLWHVTPDSLEPLLTEAASGSPLLALSFRRIAETSLLLSRSFTRTPMWQKRLRSEELLKQSLPYAEQFPFLQEAMRECLHIYLDVNGLKLLLQRITGGEVEIVVRETNAPSPFAVQFLADYANTLLYEGDGLDDSTRIQLLGVSKTLAKEVFGEDAVAGAIDPAVAAEEAQRLETDGGRAPASPGELYMLLKRRGDLSAGEIAAVAGEAAHEWIESLHADGRIELRKFGRDPRWICADEAEMYAVFPSSESAVAFIAGRFADHLLSFTEADLCRRYPSLSHRDAEHVIDVLLAMDKIEQAPFAADENERIWTSRTVAKRLIRLSSEHARKQAEPVDPVRWCTYMSMLQHALNGTQLSGIDGLRNVIARLQGFFLPASHWESIIFPARLTGYRKEDLDLLCASGEVLWIGRKDENEKEGKIAFFLTESKPLFAPCLKQAAAGETKHPRLLAILREGGASFLTRLSRETGKAPSELLPDLLDLVWEGRVSNDQFAPLRLFLHTKGKQLAKTGSGLGRWYWTGSLAEAADVDSIEGRRDGRIAGTFPQANGIGIDASSGTAGSKDGGTQPDNGRNRSAARNTGVHRRKSAAEDELSESALHWTQHLLDSCGVVSKELVSAASPFSWDELLPVLRQLEHWGVVTRGLLIRGVQTLQFARREAIQSVRRSLPAEESDTVTILSAVDPSNPFGLAAEWPAVKGAGFVRKNGSYLVLYRGRWRYWLENNGRRVVEIPEGTPLAGMETGADSGASVPASRAAGPSLLTATPEYAHDGPDPKLLKHIFRTVLRQQGLSKIKIERWNGEDIVESAAARTLQALGAERDNRSLVLWPSQLA